MYNLLKIYLVTSIIFFISQNVLGQRGEVRPHYVDPASVHVSPTIGETVSDLMNKIKKRDPWGEGGSQIEKDEYIKSYHELNALILRSRFNDRKVKTTDLSKTTILISREAFLRDEHSYFSGRTRFCSNFGEPSENLNPISLGVKLDDYDFFFKTSFGGAQIDDVIAKAKFLFEYGTKVGAAEKDILSKTNNTFLLLPDGLEAKCIYNKTTRKLYYESGHHYIEQSYASYENFFKISTAVDEKITAKKNLIISLINDDFTRHRMQDRFEDKYIQINNKHQLSKLEKIFALHKFDKIVLVGHIENGKFMPQHTDDTSPPFEISMDEINRLQKKYDLLLFPIGCESINNGSQIGHTKRVGSSEIIEAISKALSAETYSEYYDALSMEDNPLFVNISQVENQIIFDGGYKKELLRVKKIQREINATRERSESITNAIVYSRITTGADTVGKHPTPTAGPKAEDEATPLNMLIRVFTIVFIFSLALWAIIKITIKLK